MVRQGVKDLFGEVRKVLGEDFGVLDLRDCVFLVCLDPKGLENCGICEIFKR